MCGPVIARRGGRPTDWVERSSRHRGRDAGAPCPRVRGVLRNGSSRRFHRGVIVGLGARTSWGRVAAVVRVRVAVRRVVGVIVGTIPPRAVTVTVRIPIWPPPAETKAESPTVTVAISIRTVTRVASPIPAMPVVASVPTIVSAAIVAAVACSTKGIGASAAVETSHATVKPSSATMRSPSAAVTTTTLGKSRLW